MGVLAQVAAAAEPSAFGWSTERALLWIVLLPLGGAVVNALARWAGEANKGLISGVAVGTVVGSFVLSAIAFGHLAFTPEVEPVLRYDFYEWFSISLGARPIPVNVSFAMDHLSGIMCLMVSGIASLIHIYSVGYMGDDPGYQRFMTYLNLFTASMLVLVLGSNLPLMFVGWEGVGLCSYLLIGFWWTNPDYAKAGKKAFIVNRIGDFGVLIGMFLLVATAQSFEFADINSAADRIQGTILGGNLNLLVTPGAVGVSVATLAALFIFLGCTGKSAQIPLFVWLPDAMAGPTPVSALIHAATMVTAGVYLCCRLSPVIVQSPFAMSVIAVVGALTALVAASIALVQNDIKKILAYSTVSQLGFMFAAVGSGAFTAGIFHVFTHAFFKACLFLGAGSVMHAVHAHGDADIRELGGLKKWMPTTRWTFLVSCLAIAGIFPFAGFFSKDEILLGAATFGSTQEGAYAYVGWAVFGVLVVAAFMTAFYMFRLYFRTFEGTYRGAAAGGAHGDEHEDEEGEEDEEDEEEHDEDHAHGHEGEHGHGHAEPHESPNSMTFPLIVLGVGAIVVGFLGMPHSWHLPNLWSDWLAPRAELYQELHHAQDAQNEEETTRIRAELDEAHQQVAYLRQAGEVSPAHAPGWVPWMAMALGLLAGLGGLGLAYSWYYKGDGEAAEALKNRLPRFHRLLMDKWRVDEAYEATIISFTKWLAVLAANLDRYFVDGLLTKLTSNLMRGLGFLVTRLQTGSLYVYITLFAVGAAGMAWWYTFPHTELAAESEGTSIQWVAGQGLGYQYRWDFDSDGEYDTEWSDQARSPGHDYGAPGGAYYGLVAVFTGGILEAPVEIPLTEVDEPVELNEEILGPDWWRTRTDEHTDTDGSQDPPAISYQVFREEGQDRPMARVRLVPNSALARAGVWAASEEEQELLLLPGQHATLGGRAPVRMQIAIRIRGTVEVRNSFGNLTRRTEAHTVMVQASAQAGERHEEPHAAVDPRALQRPDRAGADHAGADHAGPNRVGRAAATQGEAARTGGAL